MRCRRCQYDLSTLPVKIPDGVVQCPECAILSLVPQNTAVASDSLPPIAPRVFAPGGPLSTVALALALLGVLHPLLAPLGMVAAAAALEVSKGRRGLFPLILAAILTVFTVVLPVFGVFLWRP